MTGYGRARASHGALTAEVEVRSVNGRHLGVRARLPGEWVRVEAKVEAAVRKRVDRGTVDVFVRLEHEGARPRPRVDRELLAVYAEALDELGGGDRAHLLRLPGVIQLEEPAPSARSGERAILAALGEALDALLTASEAEGRRLARVLERELRTLERHLRAAVRLGPSSVARQHAGLRKRAADLLGGERLDADDPALCRELALLAQKADVTEELDRLSSHLDALRETAGGEGGVGRALEFLLQELGREANTVGSKANDVRLTERVVAMKGCVERLREQAANVA